MSCFAAGTNGRLDLRRRAFPLDEQMRAEWSRSMPRCTRYSVVALRRSSTSCMHARTGRLSAGAEHRHLVTICKALLMAGSMRMVCGLRHQTGAQYSAVEWTRANAAVCSVVAPVQQLEPASNLKSATYDVSFLRSDSRCRQHVNALPSVTPRYLDSEQKGKVSSLKLTFNSHLVSLLLNWKTPDAIFVVLSSGGTYLQSPRPCWALLPLLASHH